MKSFLKDREEVLKELYDNMFNEYPKEQILGAVVKLIRDVKKTEADTEYLEEALKNVLAKTETYNVLSTLYEMERYIEKNKALSESERDEDFNVLEESMKDPSYNVHRTIAANICGMYSTGAISFFGYLDCMFRNFFPDKHPKSYLGKGVIAVVACVAEVLVNGKIAEDYTERNIALLLERGVTMQSMVDLLLAAQRPYNPGITDEECERHIRGVLRKQQTFHAIHACVLIDKGVENKVFGAQFNEIVGNDEGLYGIDEAINKAITNMYGMIADTNFGYHDKAKPGIIGVLDSDHSNGKCNTFIDDTVCAIVASACGRLAHNSATNQSKPQF